MIKLTINPGMDSTSQTFAQNDVIIGAAGSPAADLILEGEALEASHVRLEKDGERYVACNLANDPFVTLNDLPFGKKTIEDQDLLQIGNTLVLFEIAVSQQAQPKMDTQDSLVAVLQNNLDSRQKVVAEAMQVQGGTIQKERGEQESNKGAVQEKEDLLDVDELADSLRQELEKIQNDEISDEESNDGKAEDSSDRINDKSELPVDKQKPITVYDIPDDAEDDYVLPCDPANLARAAKTASEKARKHQTKEMSAKPINELLLRFKKRRLWLALFVALITFMLIFGMGVVKKLQSESNQQEMHAARGVADVTLALTYARLNGIKPAQQNWTNPSFLKTSIEAVLSPYHQAIVEIGNHGEFQKINYLLRIYTDREVSRFVIIAQPEASLMQWIAPQKAIVVDSKSMVLRKISDLKALNRLLVNPYSLSDKNSHDIETVLEDGEIVSLSLLADTHNENGFLPPKALDVIQPGAENYIYNAPRYSQVGEELMEEAIVLASQEGKTQKLKKFKQSLKHIQQLPSAVLYTSKGMKMALQAQKALYHLFPGEKFLIAYLRPGKDGEADSSHLIMDTTPAAATSAVIGAVADSDHGIDYDSLVAAAKTAEYLGNKVVRAKAASNSFEQEIDPQNPLYLQITKLAKQRKEQLQPIAAELSALVLNQVQNDSATFSHTAQELLQDFIETDNSLREEITIELSRLYRDYRDMPLSVFQDHVQMAGLGELRTNPLEPKSATRESEKRFDENILNMELERIENADSFQELDYLTKDLSERINSESVSDPETVIKYQNRTRSQVLEKIHDFLLSSEGKLGPESYTPHNRWVLAEILKRSWVTDPEEQEFYLIEFDYHAEESERLM